MNANLFEIVKTTGYFRKLDEVSPGCTLSLPDQEEEVLKSFQTEAEALEALKGYKSSLSYVDVRNTHFYVEEYSVRDSEVDEDGEFSDGCDYEPAAFDMDDIDSVLRNHCYEGEEFEQKFIKRFKEEA